MKAGVMLSTQEISALNAIAKEFRRANRKHPDFFYGVIDGDAVSNGGFASEVSEGIWLPFDDYLKEHICNWRPFSESVGYKWPLSFFFGKDWQRGVKALAGLARELKQVRAGSCDLQTLWLDVHQFTGDDLPEHELIHWLIHYSLNHPMPTVGIEKAPPRIIDFPSSPEIFVASIDGEVGLGRFNMVNQNRQELWQAALESVRARDLPPVDKNDPEFIKKISARKTLDSITVIRTGIFGALAAMLAAITGQPISTVSRTQIDSVAQPTMPSLGGRTGQKVTKFIMLLSSNPNISDRELAKLVPIARNTAKEWRAKYSTYIPQSETPSHKSGAKKRSIHQFGDSASAKATRKF
ncbi:MAG TPA: hypothetical protein VGG19_06020 [Tepidisphaeraceae bacterium]|jgi:hypothetical protein